MFDVRAHDHLICVVGSSYPISSEHLAASLFACPREERRQTCSTFRNTPLLFVSVLRRQVYQSKEPNPRLLAGLEPAPRFVFLYTIYIPGSGFSISSITILSGILSSGVSTFNAQTSERLTTDRSTIPFDVLRLRLYSARLYLAGSQVQALPACRCLWFSSIYPLLAALVSLQPHRIHHGLLQSFDESIPSQGMVHSDHRLSWYGITCDELPDNLLTTTDVCAACFPLIDRHLLFDSDRQVSQSLRANDFAITC